MKPLVFLSLILLEGPVVPSLAQTFDVASVRINTLGSGGGEGRTDETITSSAGSLILKNVTLASCVKYAWTVRDFQVTGEPDWFSTKRYDIWAKALGPAADAELRKMLQSLLAERFQLRVRLEPKQLPVYALVVARTTLRLKTSAGTDPASMRPAEGVLEFRNTSMPEFAERLASRPLNLDRPVVDETGLNGGYDFSMKFANNTVELKQALEDIERGTGPSILSVVQEQLGLKLEPRKAPLPVLVVEHAVELPREN